MTRTLAALALVALIGGCGPSAVETGGDPQSAQGAGTSEPAVEPKPAETPSPQIAQGGETDADAATTDAETGEIGVPDAGSGDVIADETFQVSGARWRAKGFRIQVTELHFTSAENACPDGATSEFAACWDVEDEDWKTIIAATIQVRNRTGRSVDAFPDQAVMVLGPAQADASMDGPAVGGTFYDGVEAEGQATWKSKRTVEELVEVGKARLIMPQPYWTDDFENLLGPNNFDDVDLTIKW